jgi:hypothetical protein
MKKIIAFFVFLLTFQSIYSQCNSWENYPFGKEKALEQHVLYRDKFKAKKYKESYEIWQDLFKFVQIPLPNKSTHFLDGIEMCLYFAKTDINKNFWLERADTLWEKMFKCNGETIDQKSRQAYTLMYNNYKLNKVWLIFERIIDSSTSVPSTVISNSSRLAVFFYKNNMYDFNENKINELYLKLKRVYQSNSKNADSISYNKYWKDAKIQFETVQENMNCEYWKDKWLENNDTLTIQSLSKFCKNISKCGEDDSLYSYLKQKLWNWKKNLAIETEYQVLENDTTSIYRKIIACKSLMQYDSANFSMLEKRLNSYYEELNLSSREWVDDKDRSEELYRRAYQLYLLGDFISSRNFARAASRWCPNWGDPYILVGLMYADKINTADFESRTRIWTAIDEWNKAAKADSNKTEEARNLIKNYTPLLPTKLELFQRGIQEGTILMIGNWIQQSTIVKGI